MVDSWPADDVIIPGLSEGVILPEKEEGVLRGCLFKNRNQAKELFVDAQVSKEPVLVRVLVGTREGIERWLRISGPASSALWVEVDEDKFWSFSGNGTGDEGFLSGQLRLAYRLRSYTANYLNILEKALLGLSSFHRSSLVECGFSDGNEHIISVRRWLLVMSAGYFRQLLCMMEHGGVLAEFQCILMQLVDIPNFLDVDFQLLDLTWSLSRYPYLLNLDGIDLLVINRDLNWTVLRFDCLEGLMRICKGENISDAVPQGKFMDVHDWNLWEEFPAQKDARRIGPLGAIVFDIFYLDGKGFIGGIAVQETLDCLVSSWKEAGKKMKYQFFDSGATVYELKAKRLFPVPRLLSEEQSALMLLGSSNKDHRRSGLESLVDLLLSGLTDSLIENNRVSGSTSSRDRSSRELVINWTTFHEMNCEDSNNSGEKRSAGTFDKKFHIGWIKLLDWLDKSFVEILLEEAVSKMDTGKEAELDSQKVSDVCLKVIDIMPGEGSRRFSASLLARLRQAFSKLVAGENEMEDRSDTHENIIKLSQSIKEVQYISKILALVVQRSSVAASVVAVDGGANLVLETFLHITGIFSLRNADGINKTVLPGEVLELPGMQLKINSMLGAESAESWHGIATSANHMIDQLDMKRAFHSTGLARELMMLIYRKVGIPTTVKGFSVGGLSSKPVSVSKLQGTFKSNRQVEGCLPLNVLSSFLNDAKYYFLSGAVAILTNRSFASLKIREAVIQTFHGEKRLQLVKCFIHELIQILRNGQSLVSEEVHEHMFRIISTLDKVQDVDVQADINRQDADWHTMFSVLLLTEIGSQLKSALLQQKILSHSEMDNGGKLNLKTDFSNSLSDLWITIGSFLQVLTGFVCKWPEKGGASLVFQCCGWHIENTMHILALSKDPTSWKAGQLLTMQNLLRLFGTSIEDSGGCGSATQAELDRVVWKALLDNDDHWELIRSYSHWIVFEACHRCVWNLLEDYCWSAWEPLEVHDFSGNPTFEPGNLSTNWLPKWLPSLQCEEIPLKNLVGFLRIIITLMQRRLNTENDTGLDLSHSLMPGKARALLEFLMNPVDGVLVKLLKGERNLFPENSLETARIPSIYFHVQHYREDLRNLMPLCTQRQCINGIHDPASPEIRRYSHPLKILNGRSGNGLSPSICNGYPSMWYDLSYLAASNIEIASVHLLASIFGLKLSNKQRNLEFDPSAPRMMIVGNPFLSSRYAGPFLDFHFLRFIQLYCINLEQAQKASNRLSEPSLQKIVENRYTVAWSNQESSPSEIDIRDEQISVECAVHLQVLISLGQNQTEEVNGRFKQLRAMDFLVHQISLEYEASQVATPRAQGNKLPKTSNKSPAAENMNCPSQDSSSSIATPSLAVLKKGPPQLTPVFSLDFGRSKKFCLTHGKRTFGKNLHGICKEVPKLQLGFLSSRTSRSVEHMETSSCDSYLLNRPFTGRNEFIQKWQEMMKSSIPIPKNPTVIECTKTELCIGETQEGSGGARQTMRSEDGEEEDIKQDPTVNGKAVYCGRFFDLNEEVERELADEEDSDSLEEDSDNDPGDDEPEDRVRTPDPCSLNIRPSIPKLNLPKSARKGEQQGSVSQIAEIKSGSLKVDKKSPAAGLPGETMSSHISNSSYKSSESSSAAYDTERMQRRIYRNSSLHLFLLELYISLMLTPQGTLDACYSDRFQTETQKLNAPFFLFYHLNHIANSYLMPCLTERMKTYHPSAFRVLRLSWRPLFKPSVYRNRIRIAHGAFAQIYKATYDGDGSEEENTKLVVLKTVDLPKGPHDPCKFFDIFSEVQILEKFMGEPRVCQLLDYGVESETYVLVLKHYKCSLRAWRLNHGTCLGTNGEFSNGGNFLQTSGQTFFDKLPLYLEVYSAILDAVKLLEMHNVVHYDLKCDNVLLEPVDSLVSEEDFWDPMWQPEEDFHPLPFRVCLTDFGQSKASIFQGGECTFRNRGTEYVKSPEMLKLLCGGTNSDANVDECVGKSVDVWGLGCLLYELLAAEYLLYDEDWMRFFIRVTMQSEDLITKEKASKIGNFSPIIDFIRFILVRDPLKRPTLDEVRLQFKQLQSSLRNSTHQNMEEAPPSDSMRTDSDLEESSVPQQSLKSWYCWCCK